MGPSRFLVESAPGAWSSELHSRLSLYLICPIPPARWKSALSTGNPGSWNKQRQNGSCNGQGFSEEGEAGRVGVGRQRCQCLVHYCALRNAWEMSRSTSPPLGEPVSPGDPLTVGSWGAWLFWVCCTCDARTLRPPQGGGQHTGVTAVLSPSSQGTLTPSAPCTI